jgi:hypothetical protein
MLSFLSFGKDQPMMKKMTLMLNAEAPLPANPYLIHILLPPQAFVNSLCQKVLSFLIRRLLSRFGPLAQ